MTDLQTTLLADMQRLGLTAEGIKTGKQKNPYPIGTKSIWYLAKVGEKAISKSLSLIMKDYFEQEPKTQTIEDYIQFCQANNLKPSNGKSLAEYKKATNEANRRN